MGSLVKPTVRDRSSRRADANADVNTDADANADSDPDADANADPFRSLDRKAARADNLRK